MNAQKPSYELRNHQEPGKLCPDITVQVDESKFGTLKYNKGKQKDEIAGH